MPFIKSSCGRSKCPGAPSFSAEVVIAVIARLRRAVRLKAEDNNVLARVTRKQITVVSCIVTSVGVSVRVDSHLELVVGHCDAR